MPMSKRNTLLNYDNLMREYFLFYRSFFEAICHLPVDIQVEVYPAIAAYALDDVQPTGLSPIAQSIFALVKPMIDANNRRRDNGRLGGAPSGNKNARKKTTKNNQKQPSVDYSVQPKTTEKQPNKYYILSSSNEESNNNTIIYNNKLYIL